MYKIIASKRAHKDMVKINRAGFGRQAAEITATLIKNPYKSPPRFKKMDGDLNGCFSRRINVQHRCAKLSPTDIERRLAFIKNSRGMFAGRGWSSERFMKNKKSEEALEV